MSDRLPDNVVQIEILKMEYNRGRRCNCLKPKYLLDTANREVTCSVCGLPVDSFEALNHIAFDVDRWNWEVRRLFDQRKELLDWKPWLLPLREVERVYRGGHMLPYCPHCNRGILAEELARGFINKKDELERRKFEGKKFK